MGFFRVSVSLFVLTLLSVSGEADAFTLLYTNAHGWYPSTVTLDYNFSNCPGSLSAATILNVLQDATSVWNGIPSATVTVNLGSPVSLSPSAANARTAGGNPVVLCDNATFQTITGGDPSFVVAAAKVNNSDSGGHPIFGAIYMNAQSGNTIDKIYSSSSALLTVILAHEMGHLLGLGHSADKNALMYYDATGRSELGTTQDDVDGITYLYPRQEPAAAKAFGCGTLAAVSSSKGGRRKGDGNDAAGFALLAALCMAFALWMRRCPQS